MDSSLQAIQNELNAAQEDIEKARSGVGAAGTRVRNRMMNIKKLVQVVRQEMLDVRGKNKTKR